MNQHLRLTKIRLFSILFGLSIFFCGCSTTYIGRSTEVGVADSYKKMNENLKGRSVKIELKKMRLIPGHKFIDQKWQLVRMEQVALEKISVKDVNLCVDSISWTDKRTNLESKVGIGRLHKIVFKNLRYPRDSNVLYSNALNSIGQTNLMKFKNHKNHSLGALEGLGFGVVGGLVSSRIALGDDPGDFGGLIVLAGMVAGALIGALSGLIIGHRYRYDCEFEFNEESDCIQTKIPLKKE